MYPVIFDFGIVDVFGFQFRLAIYSFGLMLVIAFYSCYYFLDRDLRDMGYDEKDRINNLKRIAFASKLLADNGITVIVAAVASLGREFLRKNLDNYIQIFVNASIDTVVRRDTKGMYKKLQEQF